MQCPKDAFNRMKNCGQQSYAHRYQNPRRSFANLIRKRVLNTVYKFSEAAPDHSLVSRDVDLPNNAFKPLQETSLPMGEIVGQQQATAWWSPGAENWHCQFADVLMMRTLQDQNRLEMVSKAWLGICATPSIPMLLKPANRPDQNTWYLPIASFDDSAVLVLPAVLTRVRRNEYYYFNFDHAHLEKKVETIVITDLSDWEATAAAWKPPSWTWDTFDRLNHTHERLPVGVHLFKVGLSYSLQEFVGRKCFYSMGVETLRKFMTYWGLQAASGKLFDILLALMTHCLPHDSEESILKLMHFRLARARGRVGDVHAELLELDEGIDMFDREEQKVLRGEKKTRAHHTQDTNEFARSLAAARKKHMKSVPKAGSRAREKLVGGPPRRFDVPPSQIPQDQANKYKPPGSYVWRGRKVGCWAGHLDPYSRCSFSWRLYGNERNAFALLIKALWTQWCELECMSEDMIPISDLGVGAQIEEDFDDDDGADA